MDKTKKNKGKFIIESSSSSSSSSNSPGKTLLKRKTKKITKPANKKKLLIIESSSTPTTPSPIKEKIEILNPDFKKGIQTDLKIYQDTNQMSKQSDSVKPSGRLNEKFIELMEQLADIMLKQGEPFRARAYQKA